MDSSKQDFLSKKERPRSQSLCSLQSEDNATDSKLYRKPSLNRTYSDSSVDFCMPSDTEEYKPLDSGICDRMSDADMLVVLEQKIDRLNEMFREQCRLLNTMKDEIRSSKMMIQKTQHAHNTVLVDVMKKAFAHRVHKLSDSESTTDGRSDEMNNRAKILLSAIESPKEVSLDKEIRENLISFLQSKELKEEMVRATAESVRSMIGGCFSRDMSMMYLPILERSHRRLIRHIHRVIQQAFIELEDKSSSLFKSVSNTSGALRRALERHKCLLEAASDPGKNIVNALQCMVEELLQNELKDWRQKVLDMFSARIHSDVLPEQEVVPIESIPASTPQPAEPQVSIIDQMMKVALINKQIEAGDVNGSFEAALTAGDLSLVMAACRAAEPDKVFIVPCQLKQPVLLSLIQQLATDMLHETQLKCRYLEEAIINLNISDPDTRVHLPLVVGEIRTHLSKFLTAYPNHVANKRITLIIMAAGNLLK